MKINRDNFTPPGYDPEQSEKALYIVLMVISVLMSFSFFYRLDDALFHLYIIEGSKRILIEGAVMTDFIGLLEWSFYGFPVTACIAPFFIGYRYAYFFKESKSIYLIKRLPAKGEIFRRCAVVPLAAAVIALVTALILFLLYFAIYMLATPDACLAPGQWSKIWEVRL